MVNDEARRNDEIRTTKKDSSVVFFIWAFWLPLAFVVRASSFLSLVDHELVPVWISKLRHPTNWSLSFFDVESHTALFKFRDSSIDVVNFEGDCRSIARGFPRWMTANTDRDWAKIILDPCAVHLRGAGFELECFLVKFPRALFIGNRYANEGHFVCDHLQTPFSSSGLSL
jgi:hypothetical protein